MENIKIIQVIPCKSELLGVYHVDREIRTYPVEYLALCDDGRLLGLRLSLDGFYEVCDQSEGFMGLCNPDENGFYKFCAHKYKE